ncbi:Transmembrane protein [Auxenochlorella protothecoides]|uniref:Transmembrane protein n=1 Tax=Auxenochlorella protothecoides TaxID=3075 RepID=A0A087SFL6_AUXPR|nr:Transmembrane protein [Auxenochlorella protothecoides]KFM24520.1 Transmembrane protein [Auxenochlorella protothecoides]
MKETVIRVEDQPLPRPVDDGSLEWAPGVGVGLPDRVRDASVSVSAALIATAVRNGAAGAMVATTRILLAFNALAFSRQVVVAMVNRGSAAEAGQLCCVAVEGGNSDIVVRLSIELLVSGFTREAAAVAAAFYAAARMRWASADPVAQLLSQAIVAAVRAEHAEQVADVTDQLVEGSQNELVLDIMRAMVAEGHGQEAGEISVAALKLGKADVLSQITHELGGAGEVGVLTSVGVNAAVAGAKAAADSLMEATTHLAGCQPAGKSPAPSENGKGLPPESWSEYFRGLPYKLRGGLDTALPIPDVHELFWSFVGAFVSIMAISLLNHFAGVEEQIVYLVGSFGASAVLLFAVTESKLAQPRNFVGGQILGALVGLGIRHAIHVPWVASPLAMALSLTGMQLTSTTHPPGGATALIIAASASIPKWAGFSYVVGVAGGCAIMLAVALITNNLAPRRRYPTFWW